MKSNRKIIHRIGILLSAVGPGIFLIGYNIGTGSITTMASAGSRYGMGLFWTLVLSCIFTFVLMVGYGRYTIVTGETALAAYRKHLPVGCALALYAMLALIIGELAALIGIMGIVVDLIQEWSRVLFQGEGFNPLLIAVIIIGGSYYLLWNGRYSRFEKFLTVLEVMMGCSFLMCMMIVVPAPGELITGLIPRIPQEENA